MSATRNHEHGPMSYEHASHLLNPLRSIILSPKSLAKRLDLHKDSQVLEVGSGPGYFSLEIARNIPAGKLTLIDIQQEMLDLARQWLEKQRIMLYLEKISPIQGYRHLLQNWGNAQILQYKPVY